MKDCDICHVRYQALSADWYAKAERLKELEEVERQWRNLFEYSAYGLAFVLVTIVIAWLV